jgi:hypothetical protein
MRDLWIRGAGVVRAAKAMWHDYVVRRWAALRRRRQLSQW